MLFPEEDAPLLKAWIVKRIERTSDADAEVLAEYIIALLKHDGTKDEVRKLCEAEIPDFLTEDPTAFLDEVFQAIVYRSYVPGAAAPPPSSASVPPVLKSAAEVYGQQSQDNGTQGGNGAGAGGGYDGVNGWTGNMPPSGPRKRRYRDLDAPGGQEGGQHMGGSRPIKNPRQQGRGRGQMPDGVPEQGQQQQQGPVPPNGYFPPTDWSPQNMEAFMGGMGNLGMPFPGMPMPPFEAGGRGGRGGRQRRRGRCRDFDKKGFCDRGSSCVFDHGHEGQAGFMPPMGPAGDGADPDAMIDLSNPNLQAMPYGLLQQNTGRGRGDRRGGRNGKKGRARAPFSAEGPVNDRSKSTIVVENIPEEHFSEEEVRNFFSQFGPLVEVSMQPYKHLAIVKYEKWGSANAAYRSPKVIFDNRFVRVFWYKDEMNGDIPASVPNGSVFSGGAQGDVDMDAAEPEIDPEEFQRRQEEAQKQHQERESKRMELEQQRQELEKKQQALMEKHREETRKLQEKLLQKNGGDASNGTTNNENGTSSGTNALRAKLAALEQEAKILGIDPDGDDGGASYPPRGGYRGRGGASFRGRGRGGGFRSVDNRHAAYAQYTIDNRPKKLALTGVDFTIPQKDESLRHFLLNLGEFESVDPTPTTTYVSFRDRKTAERMYYTLNGKELPGVDGKLDLQWVNTPLPPVTPSGAKASSAMADTDAGASDAAGNDAAGGAMSSKNGGDEDMDEEEGEIGEETGAMRHDGQVENEYIEQRVEDDDDAY